MQSPLWSNRTIECIACKKYSTLFFHSSFFWTGWLYCFWSWTPTKINYGSFWHLSKNI